MEYVRLKDIGQIITGNTPPTSKPEYYGDYMPFIKATDIPIGVKCTLVTEQSYSKLAAEKYKKSLVPKGSTCVVTIGSIGKKMTYAHTDLFVNQAINAIVPKDSYDNEYIFYNVRCSVLPQLKKLDSGTTSGRENISKTSFSSIRIPVIKDKNVQRRIGVILSTYDSLIENNTKRIRILEKMAENLYKEWFVRFRFPGHEKMEIVNGLPEGWIIKKIKDYGKIETGKTPSMQVSEYYGGKYLFIKTPDMHGGVFVCSTEETLSELGNKSQPKKLLPPNSIMVSCIGTAGIVALNAKEGHTNQQINSIIPSDMVNLQWLYFTCKELRATIELFGATGATMTNLSKGKFEKLKVLEPTIALRSAFHNRVSSMFKLILKLENENSLLARQRDLLLPRLMSGKLEV